MAVYRSIYMVIYTHRSLYLWLYMAIYAYILYFRCLDLYFDWLICHILNNKRRPLNTTGNEIRHPHKSEEMYGCTDRLDATCSYGQLKLSRNREICRKTTSGATSGSSSLLRKESHACGCCRSCPWRKQFLNRLSRRLGHTPYLCLSLDDYGCI